MASGLQLFFWENDPYLTAMNTVILSLPAVTSTAYCVGRSAGVLHCHSEKLLVLGAFGPTSSSLLSSLFSNPQNSRDWEIMNDIQPTGTVPGVTLQANMPGICEGHMMKKRKYPLKGWHRVGILDTSALFNWLHVKYIKTISPLEKKSRNPDGGQF